MEKNLNEDIDNKLEKTEQVEPRQESNHANNTNVGDIGYVVCDSINLVSLSIPDGSKSKDFDDSSNQWHYWASDTSMEKPYNVPLNQSLNGEAPSLITCNSNPQIMNDTVTINSSTGDAQGILTSEVSSNIEASSEALEGIGDIFGSLFG